ncbi:hypothetical protein BC826DRAFT_1034294 [Russula brevipes]|nr:hypothetical protein BC826DRAFT_1034294 [Russula brevipes]
MRDFSIPSSTRTTMDRKFYQDPRYQDPRYQDPRYQDPRYQDPRYQDPRYQSDPQYQNPSSNPPPQPEQFTGAPHQLTTYDAHPNYQDQHAYQTHSEGSQRSHAPGHHSGYLDTSHADGRMAFPEPHPQRSPSGRPAPTLGPSQPTHNPNPGSQYQQTGQYPYPSSSAPSGGRQVYTTGGSVTGGTAQYAQPTVQPDLGGGFTVTRAQPQDQDNEEYDSRSKGPPTRIPAAHPQPATCTQCIWHRVDFLMNFS